MFPSRILLLLQWTTTIILLLLFDKHEAFSPCCQRRRLGRQRQLYSCFAAKQQQQQQQQQQQLDTITTTNNAALSPSLLSSHTSAAATTAAPVYITIGPPCSGKTEALRQLLLQDGYDPDLVFSDKEVQLSRNAYHRISLEGFLFPNSTYLERNGIGKEILVGSTTVQDRLMDPTFERSDQELRHVLLRVAGRISEDEFQQRAKELGGDANNFRRNAVYEDLCTAVEQVVVQAVSEVICQMQFLEEEENQKQDADLPYTDKNDTTSEQKLDYSSINATQAHLLSARALIQTPYVEIFVPQHVLSSIPQAEKQLSELLETDDDTDNDDSNSPAFWSNTNSRPKEYVAALEAAQAAGRPVQFCAWTVQWEVDRVELLRRNVARFRKSGRYIPAGAVSAALGRVIRLVKCAQQLCQETARGSKSQLYDYNAAFCELAGFRRDPETGLVTKIGPPLDLKPQPQQRYRRRTPYKRPDVNKEHRRSDVQRQKRQRKEIQRQKRHDLRSYIQKTIVERKANNNNNNEQNNNTQ
mmetsp:Transcript_3387/g.5137  ORF Transcript_3387/g.5137 Transcript_3387/m.5137 type:complete len:526 (+) Transcript_3387:75-1652(+)